MDKKSSSKWTKNQVRNRQKIKFEVDKNQIQKSSSEINFMK